MSDDAVPVIELDDPDDDMLLNIPDARSVATQSSSLPVRNQHRRGRGSTPRGRVNQSRRRRSPIRYSSLNLGPPAGVRDFRTFRENRTADRPPPSPEARYHVSQNGAAREPTRPMQIRQVARRSARQPESIDLEEIYLRGQQNRMLAVEFREQVFQRTQSFMDEGHRAENPPFSDSARNQQTMVTSGPSSSTIQMEHAQDLAHNSVDTLRSLARNVEQAADHLENTFNQLFWRLRSIVAPTL